MAQAGRRGLASRPGWAGEDALGRSCADDLGRARARLAGDGRAQTTSGGRGAMMAWDGRGQTAWGGRMRGWPGVVVRRQLGGERRERVYLCFTKITRG